MLGLLGRRKELRDGMSARELDSPGKTYPLYGSLQIVIGERNRDLNMREVQNMTVGPLQLESVYPPQLESVHLVAATFV
jgi:hypothetical protein